MELEEQYGMADLRQYVNGRPPFPTIPPPGDLFSSGHRNLTQPQHHYEMVMVGAAGMVPRGHHFEFRAGSTTAATSVTGASTSSVVSGMEMEGGDGCGGGGLGGGDGGSGRWPRQETLTLLEIRSRLDSKFKEANQKGPLWDEVSRIMSEEHGYQRSGKKCREKFENLYKYYKKTKEGKAGRQDGKHYRFFRQLEALYGDNNTSRPNSSSVSETQLMGNNFQFHNPNNSNINHVGQPNLGLPFQAPKLCNSLTLSNSSEMGITSSSDDEIDTNEALLTENDSDEKKKKKKRRRGWKAKIRDFIDSQMRKIMEKQEEWLERMMKTLESKEQERILRDEEWRNQEAARMERDRKFWANERGWMEARDSALMEALKKLIRGKEARNLSPENENESETITNTTSDGWSDCEITKLMELRSSSADSSRFEESGCSEEALWEEIAAKMSCLGYNRSALVCKEKWDRISNYLRKTKEWNNKKGREDLKSCSHFHHHNNESVYNQGGGGGGAYYWDINEQGAEPEICTRVAPNDSCFRLLVGADGGGNVNLWENYGVKLSKE